MAIQELRVFQLPPSNEVYPFQYLTLLNFEQQANTFDLSVIDAIVSEFIAFFFPLTANFCYMCIWTLSLQRTDTADIPFKIFDGNPPRRNFGYYARGRGNAVLDDGLITYETQTLPKSAFMFSNLRFNRNGGVVSVSGTPTSVFMYSAGAFSGFTTPLQSAAVGLPGATRVRLKFNGNTQWNCQIQAQVFSVLTPTTGTDFLAGDVI